MKYMLVSAFVFVFSAFAKAQSTQSHNISIAVIDLEKNQPLADAVITLSGTSKTITSKADGTAVINNIPSGNYTITVTLVGFKPQSRTLTVPQKKSQVFMLESIADSLEEITIQSTRSTRSFKRTPTRIEFIGGEELTEKTAMNSTNIAMILRESTGIQMQQTSQSSANQSIRIQGLDGRYTQLLKDGFPLYAGFSGGLSVMQIPPLDIAQFEIIKGSASTLYGGGAIAGLVNMQSKQPDDDKVLDVMAVGT